MAYIQSIWESLYLPSWWFCLLAERGINRGSEFYLHLILTTQEESINSKMEAWQLSANVVILS